MADSAAPETDAPITVVLVDDHAVVRTALARTLDAAGIAVVGEAGDGRSALEVAQVKRPDVVVLDVELGAENALELLPDMLKWQHKPAILMLSMHDDPELVQAAMSAGAKGYVLKEAAESDLIDAIKALAAGEHYVHPTLGARLARAAAAAGADGLTEREREIVRMLALGHTNQEIASQLFLSVRTIETHRAHAMQKLGMKTRAELVQWALDQGLIGQRLR